MTIRHVGGWKLRESAQAAQAAQADVEYYDERGRGGNTRLAGWAEAEQGAQPAGVVGAVFSRAAAAARPSGRAHAPRAAGPLLRHGRPAGRSMLYWCRPADVPTAAAPVQAGAELRLHAVAWLRFGADAIAQQAQRSAGAPASQQGLQAFQQLACRGPLLRVDPHAIGHPFHASSW